MISILLIPVITVAAWLIKIKLKDYRIAQKIKYYHSLTESEKAALLDKHFVDIMKRNGIFNKKHKLPDRIEVKQSA